MTGAGKPTNGGAPPAHPVIEAYKAGIDRTLLRENLRRTVAEHMANLVELQHFADELRRAGRARK